MKTFFFYTLLLLLSANSLADTVNGRIEFANRIDLSLPVSGIIEKIGAKSGATIVKGQELLALEKTPFEAAQTQAQSRLHVATADDTEAKRDLEHAKELYDRSVLSNVDLETATLNAARTEARKRDAEAQLDSAQYFLKNSSIIAPFDGWLLAVNVKVGESVNNTLSIQTLISVAEVNLYDARFALPLKTIRRLKMGNPVKIRVAGKNYSGEIVSNNLEPSNTTTGQKSLYQVQIRFNSQGRLLRAGEAASLTLK